MSAAPDPGVPPGAQSERTALAWRRTALAVATGSLVGGRLAAPALGPTSWAVAGLGIGLAIVVWLAAHRRWLVWQRALAVDESSDRVATTPATVSDTSARRAAPGGALPAACAAGALVLGLLSLAAIVS